MKKVFLLIWMCFFNIFAFGYEESKWFEPQIKDSAVLLPKGLVLIVHGLNMKPSKMDFIAQSLADEGFAAFRIVLKGHEGNAQNKMGQVSRDEWFSEIKQASNTLQQRSQRAGGIPIYFVGFSLGALLQTDIITTQTSHHKYAGQVLFAPPLALHYVSFLLRLLSPFPDLIIPSASLSEFMANSGTSMSAYNALFETVKHLCTEVEKCKHANIPTAVFIDPDDELVDAKGVVKFIQKFNLDNWDLMLVNNKNAKLKKSFHHLITDPDLVGDAMWKKIWQKIHTKVINPS